MCRKWKERDGNGRRYSHGENIIALPFTYFYRRIFSDEFFSKDD
jgi:hypothetical protein